MTTATYEPLFIKEPDPNELFEKEATIARMPDDDRKWPETVLSELHKQLPFLSGMDIALNFTRIQPEAGYGFGYALVRGQKNAVGLPTPKSENQMVKIPIVVADRQLEPFHVFNFEGRTIPLTQSRFEEALENPRVFAGPDKTPKTSKSLIDQLYPPYQQRQGFGRIVDGSGATGASMGINKVAKAISDMTPEEIQRLSELKRNEGLDRAQAGLTKKDKGYALRDRLLAAGLAGAGLGAGKKLISKAGREALRTTGGAASTLGLGAATGIGVNTAVSGIQSARRKGREKDRASETYKQHFKKANMEDIPNYRMADNEDIACKNCKFYGSSTEMGMGVCNKFSADVKEAMVCDEWESMASPEKLAAYNKFLMGARK